MTEHQPEPEPINCNQMTRIAAQTEGEEPSAAARSTYSLGHSEGLERS